MFHLHELFQNRNSPRKKWFHRVEVMNHSAKWLNRMDRLSIHTIWDHSRRPCLVLATPCLFIAFTQEVSAFKNLFAELENVGIWTSAVLGFFLWPLLVTISFAFVTWTTNFIHHQHQYMNPLIYLQHMQIRRLFVILSSLKSDYGETWCGYERGRGSSKVSGKRMVAVMGLLLIFWQ